VAYDNIAESNIRALARDPTGNAYHESIHKGWKSSLHVNSNGCGAASTELAGWQASDSYVVLPNAAQSILSQVIYAFVFFVEGLSCGCKLNV
jgi:hypothetical protein